MLKNGHPSEAEVQTALFQWASYIPELEYMYAVPNGGSRHPLESKNLKRQGVKAGVPDICLPLAKGHYHGLYIEMKVENRKPSQKQKEYIEYLNSQGYKAVVCNGFDEARECLVSYLRLE